MTGYVTARWLQALEAKLSLRDEAVLRRVSDLRFVTGAQLTRLHFASDDPSGSARTARRSLLRLVKIGALARLPRVVGGQRAGSAGFVYHLAAGGQRLAMARGWQPERRRRRSMTSGQLFVQHTLHVAELHTVLVEADRSRRFELLELSGEPSCWRAHDGFNSQPVTLKPDSYARLAAGDYEDSYFFEVDRGTEGSRAIETQLNRYLDYYRRGNEQSEHGVFPIVLWLTPNVERSDVIQASLNRLLPTDRQLFKVATQGDVLTAVSDKSAIG